MFLILKRIILSLISNSRYLWNRIDPNAYSLPVPYDPDIHTFRYPDSRVRTRFAAAPQSELRSGGGPVARPRKGRGTEYGGPDRTQRAESFRNDGEILPLCRYATKHPERPSRPTRTEGPIPAGRTRPCPTASENTNPKPKIPHHETSASSARVAVPRPTQCGARQQNLPKPGRLPERPVRDRARPVSETARRRSRIRTLRIQARLHGPGNEKDAQGNGVRRRRRYALREPDLFE